MPNIWDGTHLFLWQADQVDGGNATAMIQVAKQLGLTGVLIKFADGDLVNDPVSQQFMRDFQRLAPLFKQAGLTVGGWMYQYLTDVPGEVDACVQAVASGADWLVLDAESDVYGKTGQVADFGQQLRGLYPHLPVGLSSFAIASYHTEVPFEQYNAFVDVMMPQMYWADIGWDVDVTFQTSVQSYQSFGKPLAPTGQSYGNATPEQMARFVQLCKNHGYSGVSWWDWQSASPAQLSAIRDNRLLPPPAPAPVTGSGNPPGESNRPPAIASDVPDHAWFSQAVKTVLQEGFMHVDDQNRFGPNDPASRAMLAEVLLHLYQQLR